MKYIITESQLEKMVFKYLDNQDFKIIKKKYNPDNLKTVISSRLYFVKDESDESAEIVFDYWKGILNITSELCEEIVQMFSLDDESDAELIINEWVGSKINKDIDILKTYSIYKDSFSGAVFDIKES